MRKKRAFYATDEEYRTIQLYAKAKGREISEFVRSTALSEINRHIRKKDLKELVREYVLEALKDGFPARGMPSEDVYKADGKGEM